MFKKTYIPLLVVILFFINSSSAQMRVISNIKGHVYDYQGNSLINVNVTAWVNGTLRASDVSQNDSGNALFIMDVNGTINEVGAVILFKVEGVDGIENTSFILWVGDQNFTLHQWDVNHSIVLNEFKTSADGWIELHNNGSISANIQNWRVSGSSNTSNGNSSFELSSGWNLISIPRDPAENGAFSSYTLPDNTMVPASSFLLMYANSTGIELNESSGEIFLHDSESSLRDNVTYMSIDFNALWDVFPENVSVGRVADGLLPWVSFFNMTPGSTNTA